MTTYFGKASIEVKDTSIGFAVTNVRDQFGPANVQDFYLAAFVGLNKDVSANKRADRLCDLANDGPIRLIRSNAGPKSITFRSDRLYTETGRHPTMYIPPGQKTKQSDIVEMVIYPDTTCVIAMEEKRPSCSCERIGASFCSECNGEFCQ